MKLIIWLLRAVLFVVLLGFAIKNSSIVTLHFFLDTAWSLPLVIVMLVFFSVGAAVGLSAALGVFLRQRRELARLSKELDVIARLQK
jgi:uncharacterized integral membrane protein